MGQRLAPSLAIAFMSKVEAPVTDLGPLLYCSDTTESVVIESLDDQRNCRRHRLSSRPTYPSCTQNPSCISTLVVRPNHRCPTKFCKFSLAL
ncbi:unnamed protein product [Angiostrongylus costaricensis]|uniref:Secreted protein n=1 Tax=Angiostrongylus costaricensis TaxID=334426 RepID=A0A0R3Q2S6_ANGCS|nr:unnamed protein product [Angiostrongylus costaricensis]